MTPIEKVTGSAVFAFAICGVLISARGDTSPAKLHLSRFAQASRHSCLDMNGRPFDWRSVNVPFAATCDAKPDTEK
jgi:hypothetical protein